MKDAELIIIFDELQNVDAIGGPTIDLVRRAIGLTLTQEIFARRFFACGGGRSMGKTLETENQVAILEARGGTLTVDFEPMQRSLEDAAAAIAIFKAQLEAAALPPAGMTISDRLAQQRDGRRGRPGKRGRR